MGVNNGDIFHADPAATTVEAPAAAPVTLPSPASPAKLCRHGPKAVCIHCRGAEKDKDGKYIVDDSVLAKNCRHPMGVGQFCLNCLPTFDPKSLSNNCLHGPGTTCNNCTVKDEYEGSVHTYIEMREHMISFCKHESHQTCVNCLPPEDVSFKIDVKCTRHSPWPHGICPTCAPPDIDPTTPQDYRHVDQVSLSPTARADMQSIVNLVLGNERAGVQRCALLFGRVIPMEFVSDKGIAKKKVRGGQRVVVEALYEPPQRFDAASGAVALSTDPNEPSALAVAAALGLSHVGWFFTKRPLVKTDPTLMPRELLAMAQLQNAHPRQGMLELKSPSTGMLRSVKAGGSQFVTMVMRKRDDILEPEAYQATDMMCSYVRDGILEPTTGLSDTVLRLRKPAAGEAPIPQIAVGKPISDPLEKADMAEGKFRVERVLVKLRVPNSLEDPGDEELTAALGTCVLAHSEFPTENRDIFGGRRSPADVRDHLNKFKRESLEKRCADFHFLVYLAGVIGIENAVLLAEAVAKKSPVPDGIGIILESIGV